LEGGKLDSPTMFRRPSPIRFSQPIEKDPIEPSTRKSTKFRRPSPIRSWQDDRGSPHKSDTFRSSYPLLTSKSEHKTQPMEISPSQSSSRTLQFMESPKISGRKRVTKPITVNDDDDDFFISTRSQSLNKTGSIKKSRKIMEQNDNKIPLSKHSAKEKSDASEKRSIKAISRDGKKENSKNVINAIEQSPLTKNEVYATSPQQISSDDFITTTSNKLKRNPKLYVTLPQRNSSDDDFITTSNKSKNNPKRRNHLRVPSPKQNFSDDDFMDISPNNKKDTTIIIDDESETLNNQSDEFRAPSPTRNKYADLPEMDLLSDEESPAQSSNSRKKREGALLL